LKKKLKSLTVFMSSDFDYNFGLLHDIANPLLSKSEFSDWLRETLNKYNRQIMKRGRKGIKTENLGSHITTDTDCGMVPNKPFLLRREL
jgi:hypothetical protein